ncbi:uncharacterized protein LOC132062390 [Lycium ferocissimum]|uniref:uncharacterized protein LOC132062390 n=1 Tax=Lycium ferocissimum TaxID=112874 RepID=UPI0028151099|nr:uncharacterized protein LOC132062390 [Lycium ferocissimum]
MTPQTYERPDLNLIWFDPDFSTPTNRNQARYNNKAGKRREVIRRRRYKDVIHTCGDDTGGYASSNGGYGFDCEEGYGGDGATYDHDEYGNYGDVNGQFDHDPYDGGPYYSGDDYESSGSYRSYEEDEGVEELDKESYSEYESYEESHTTHHGCGGGLRYIPSSRLRYESIGEDLHELGSCDEYEPCGYTLCGEYARGDNKFEDEICEDSSSGYSRTSFCDTSYTKQDGVSVWIGPRRSRP